MTYRAIPVTELLKGLEVAADGLCADFVASDKFSIGIPARLLVRPGNRQPASLSAIEDPAKPWPAMPEKGDGDAPAPFYRRLAGRQAGRDQPRILGLQARAPSRSPTAPTCAGRRSRSPTSLPAIHPVRRGLDRYVALCISCHRFKGAGQGEQGPDLGQPMNPVDYFQPLAFRKLLRSSEQVRDWPDRKMPSFNEEMLSDEDMEAVIAWLTYKARN